MHKHISKINKSHSNSLLLVITKNERQHSNLLRCFGKSPFRRHHRRRGSLNLRQNSSHKNVQLKNVCRPHIYLIKSHTLFDRFYNVICHFSFSCFSFNRYCYFVERRLIVCTFIYFSSVWCCCSLLLLLLLRLLFIFFLHNFASIVLVHLKNICVLSCIKQIFSKA